MKIYIIKGELTWSDELYCDIAFFINKEKAEEFLKELTNEIDKIKEKYGDFYEDQLPDDYCNYKIKMVEIEE